MEYRSCFDIIGPVMVGPSSSHTAGAVLIGKFAYKLLGGSPEKAEIVLYGSFADTYKGHGTDKALVGGLIGMDPDDIKIKNALEIAAERKINVRFEYGGRCPFFNHPNTTVVTAMKGDRSIRIGGASLGGGLAKIFKIDDRAVDIRLSAGEDFSAIRENMQGALFPKNKL